MTLTTARGQAPLAEPVDAPTCILVVEEDPKYTHSINMAFRSVLSRFNMVIAGCQTDIDAHRESQRGKSHYDLIVLDIDNRSIDMPQLMKSFQQDERFQHIPLVLIGERMSPEISEQAIEGNAILVSPKDRIGEMAPAILSALRSTWAKRGKVVRISLRGDEGSSKESYIDDLPRPPLYYEKAHP